MSKRNQKKIDKLRTEFLPEALEIVERPTAPLGNIIIWFVFALLFVFVLWACIGKLDEVASARGQIAADEGIQEVQAAETGIVRTVKVKEGDAVHRGDVLYCIEKEIEQKNIAYSEGEIGLLELQIELLGKLLAGEDITEYQNEDYPVQQQEVIETMIAMNEVDELSIEEYELAAQTAKNQYELADRNLGSNQDKADYLNEQKKLQDKSNRLKSTLEIELALLKGNYEYTAAEAAKYQELYEAGAKSKAEWEEKANEVENLKKQIAIKEIEIKNEALTQKSDEKNIDYQIAESKNESENQKGTLEDRKKNYESAVKNLETAKSQRKEKLYEMKQQCLEELKKYDLQIAEQYNQFENMDIVALYDGVVKSLAVDKAGSVVTAAQVVAEIIPDSTTMIVKAEVNNRDIGYVALGQDVDVKVDTYDYQKYGKLHGVVTYISPDATETEQAQKIYKVEILLERDSGKDWTVSQGMECTVEIKTDKRRIIDFFLEPLTDALDRGLKER